MKTAIYLFILIALFNSFSEPHDVQVIRRIYRSGKIIKTDYAFGFSQTNGTLKAYVVDGKDMLADSLVFTCGSELKYNPKNIK